MSVRLNLLPDLRQAKIREANRRKLATTGTILVCAVAVGIVLVLGLYNGGQKVIINNDSNQIKSKMADLTNMSGLIDALTAQAHASSLPDLYSQRVYYSHFFAAYQAADPTDVSISSLAVDETNTMKVSGTANSYTAVAKLARALAADNLTIGTGSATTNEAYFTDISIDSVSRDDTSVSFSLSATVATGATSNGKN